MLKNPCLTFVIILVIILVTVLLVKISEEEHYIPDYTHIPDALVERYDLIFDSYYIRVYVDKESGYMYLHNKSANDETELTLLKDHDGNPVSGK